MKVQIKRRKRIDIAESGALSDLAFLLIIFFIVIAVFNINKGFLLGLPQKNSSKIANVNDIIKMTLNENGRLYWMDKEISQAAAADLISERLKQRPNMIFLLKIDPETKYQNVVEVVDIVRSLEVENFSFSLIKESP